MREIQLLMRRDHLREVPAAVCPPGFRVRPYVPGDERSWAAVEVGAGVFPSEEAALAQFTREFGPHRAQLPGRMLLLETDAGVVVGTATAWHGHFDGGTRGRVHWVGIDGRWQGRGLAKPLLTAAMFALARFHDQAFLVTETTSYKGIGLYLAFGFEPVVAVERDREGWAIVAETLGRPLP